MSKRLEQAARAVLADQSSEGLRESLPALAAVLDDPQRLATAEEVSAAREQYCACSDDSIAVDDGAEASRADEGVWVQDWVWVQSEGVV